MISKGNLVQIIMSIIRIISGETAVFRLHAADPISRSLYRLSVTFMVRLMHGQGDDGCVIEVGIVGIAELKSPAASLELRIFVPPITVLIKELLVFEPVQGTLGMFLRRIAGFFLKSQTGEGSIPDRGYAGLTVGQIIFGDDLILQRLFGVHTVCVFCRLAQAIQRLVGIYHRREDAAEAVRSVEPLNKPMLRLLQGPLTNALRDEGL